MRGKKFFLITLAFLFGVLATSFFALNLGNVTYSIQIDKEIVITFNKEVNLTTGILIEPFVKADVKTKGLIGVKEVRIIPNTDLPKGENLDISFEYKKIFKNESLNFKDFVFVPINSDIKSFSINEINGVVSLQPKITLETKGETGHIYSIKTPEYTVEWKENILINKTEFTTSEILPSGLNFTLVLLDNGKTLYERKFTTSDQPRIIERTEKEYFIPGDIVDMYFNKPMDIASDPLNINAPGNGKWLTETYYSFTLGDIAPDGKYLFELKSGSKSKDGGVVIEAQSFVVNAPGEVLVEINHVEDDRQIEVKFNQPVDHSDVEFRFLTVPKIRGTFSWQDNTMYFQIEDLAYETTYNITVPREIKALFGVPNKKSATLSFTTEPTPFKNDIPLIRTKYTKGGSMAAVTSVLSYYKIKSTEETILQKMGQDATQRIDNVWGDPRKVFVGNYNDSTGYGVHASVVARVLSSYGKSVTLLTSPSISTIAKEVKAGKVVIITTADGADSWKAKDGAIIKAGKNTKTQIISGVYGKATLKGFFLHDAQTGEKYKYITASTLSNILKTVSGVTDQVIVVK